jgi:MYXO-CTERM domain-containing protein
MLRTTLCISSVAALLLAASPASARSFREQQLPAGSALSCNACHNGNQLNPFGEAMLADFLTPGSVGSADVVWGPAFAALDSDGDGVTNGQELGDPNGTWLPGDPEPAAFSFPGFATCAELPTAERSCGRCRGTATGVQRCPSVCGDGILADGAGEYCDGAELGGNSCASLGYVSGEVSCRAICTVDASACLSEGADAGADASGSADTGSEADAGEGSDDTSPVETSVTQPGGCAAGGGSAAGFGLLLVAALASRRRFRAV